ncbi:MAG: PEP-utilizing enzyme [archaeon]
MEKPGKSGEFNAIKYVYISIILSYIKKEKEIVMNLKKLEDMEWVSRWAGSYTFISCSYWGAQYYSSLKKALGIGFEHTAFVHKKGAVSFFIPKKEFVAFGTKMAARATKNPTDAKKLLNELKKNTDILLKIMKNLHEKVPTQKQYAEFEKYYDKHLEYHNFMKKTVDFLSAQALEGLLPSFKEARIYSEAVYSETEIFFRGLASAISKKEKMPAELLTCLTAKELAQYFKTKKLPKKETLQERYTESALLFENGKLVVITGKEVAKIEGALFKTPESTELKGVSAFPGVVKGIARVVLDPLNPGTFNQGDILVTGMTRPEFISLLKKSSGIVTDVGGILCHAAISARELKIPCVVGTANSTKAIKSGDLIEVDANKGIVKIIKK